MRLKSRTLSFLINFLLGTAWALVLIGILSAIFTYAGFGILSVGIHALLWAIPGLFFVLLLEYILSGFQRNEELRRQSRLLEELLEATKRNFPER